MTRTLGFPSNEEDGGKAEEGKEGEGERADEGRGEGRREGREEDILLRRKTSWAEPVREASRVREVSDRGTRQRREERQREEVI